jgi:hypothetical protein
MNSMQFSLELPDQLGNYKQLFIYRNIEEKNEIIQRLSAKLTDIYSSFLTENFHKRRPKNISFKEKPPQIFPDSSQVERFKSSLKENIISNLKRGVVNLSIKDSKNDFIIFALESSDILPTKFKDFLGLLPSKTITEVTLDSRKGIINFRMASFAGITSKS